MNPTNSYDDHLPITEACKQFPSAGRKGKRLSVGAVYRWIQQGYLPKIYRQGKLVVSVSKLKSFLSSKRERPKGQSRSRSEWERDQKRAQEALDRGWR